MRFVFYSVMNFRPAFIAFGFLMICDSSEHQQNQCYDRSDPFVDRHNTYTYDYQQNRPHFHHHMPVDFKIEERYQKCDYTNDYQYDTFAKAIVCFILVIAHFLHFLKS